MKTKARATKEANTKYFQRPLAPAPWPVLVGVCVAVTFLLFAASQVRNDYLAALCGFAVIGGGACVLDYTGRKEAARNPNRLYKAERLPGDPKLQILIVMTVFVALLLVVGAGVKPGRHASAFPYLVAAAFVFLVMPWLVAKHALRNAAKRK